MDYVYSIHARDMLLERGISEDFVLRTLQEPDWTETRQDGNRHCFKSIAEYEGRVLHVILNTGYMPNRIVTVFFDRAARRNQ